ncbi:hypothetical protein QU577_27010 [Priestia megaterium]|uniref:hypothetical protein n=1 Tax=Priestia megaterium TaxID=1404 RepID=UPI0025B0940E|nr:hypothetical protein [Priestia megaterium]MDN3365417.1 hypothetical protein [Priestia megaterium]
MNLDERFIDGVTELLTTTGTPVDWLDTDKIDLKQIFVKLKESGKMNEEVYNDVASSFKKKPAHVE